MTEDTLFVDPGGKKHSLISQASALISGQTDLIANAANLASLLFHALDDVNWAGFYFLKNDQLIVGPFQGKPACVSIPVGKGVCGTAAASGKVQRVADVHEFSGHIVCDADSRSEIVVPLFKKNGDLIGVLDVDSPLPGRFDAGDEVMLVEIAKIFMRSIG